MDNENVSNNGKGQLVIIPGVPSIAKICDEEGYSKAKIKDAKEGNFEAKILSQYGGLYKIYKDTSKFFGDDKHNYILELLAEFDSISGDFTKFKGWISISHGEGYFNMTNLEVLLEPLKTASGLIYHFHGTLEWKTIGEKYSHEQRKGHIAPLSIAPVYGAPNGRIIELSPTKIGDSGYFENAKVEYRSMSLKVEEE